MQHGNGEGYYEKRDGPEGRVEIQLDGGNPERPRLIVFLGLPHHSSARRIFGLLLSGQQVIRPGDRDIVVSQSPRARGVEDRSDCRYVSSDLQRSRRSRYSMKTKKKNKTKKILALRVWIEGLFRSNYFDDRVSLIQLVTVFGSTGHLRWRDPDWRPLPFADLTPQWSSECHSQLFSVIGSAGQRHSISTVMFVGCYSSQKTGLAM